MKWWKKLCARPPPQPPPVPLKRGPRKGKGEEETKSTTITDTNIWFGLEHLCSTGITHDGDGGIPLFSATTRGGTDLQNDAYGQVWPRLLDKENQRQGYGVSIRTVVYPTILHYLKAKFTMAQYPLSTVWTLIYRVNQIKNLIDQLTDHPLVLHGHCVEVRFIGGNLTINEMEPMLTSCFTGLNTYMYIFMHYVHNYEH